MPRTPTVSSRALRRAVLALAAVGVAPAVLLTTAADAGTPPERARRHRPTGAVVPAATGDAVQTRLPAAPRRAPRIGSPIQRAEERQAAAAAAKTAPARPAAPAPPAALPTPHCPVPVSTFIDSWGFARSGGRRHKGVDMMAPHGSPIHAPVAGHVVVHTSGLGGLTFELTMADGTVLMGTHLQSYGKQGPVQQGDVIGTVGSSGNASASGPHLHFEVHPGGGAAVNPFPYVAAWCVGDGA